jgi:hypothetical protein
LQRIWGFLVIAIPAAKTLLGIRPRRAIQRRATIAVNVCMAVPDDVQRIFLMTARDRVPAEICMERPVQGSINPSTRIVLLETC